MKKKKRRQKILHLLWGFNFDLTGDGFRLTGETSSVEESEICIRIDLLFLSDSAQNYQLKTKYKFLPKVSS